MDSLRISFLSERQESQSLVEKLELELAEQKLAFHRLQEEGQQQFQEQDQRRAAPTQDQHESLMEEVVKKDAPLAEFHHVEQNLSSSCDAPQVEQNVALLQEQVVHSISVLKGQNIYRALLDQSHFCVSQFLTKCLGEHSKQQDAHILMPLHCTWH